MNITCVIPARYESSRFQGKPLVDILGKPMIWWVYSKVIKVTGIEGVYVATDDDRIYETCINLGIRVMMTSKNHPTGVDRLSEVSKKIKSDYYVLVQGDEPLIETNSIQRMVNIIKQEQCNECVYTFKTKIHNPVDAVNNTIIKIVTALDDTILLASRSAIPYPKAGINFDYYKSVGIYAYPRKVLEKYPTLERGPLENVEDHDFMRMLENGIHMKAFKIETDTISVDTPKDLKRVIEIMEVDKRC